MDNDAAADIYRGACAVLRAAQASQNFLMSTYRELYDDYHSRINRLPLATQAEFFPHRLAIARTIDRGTEAVFKAREDVAVARDTAILTKIAALAAATNSSGMSPGGRLRDDLIALRLWRRDHLDGVDVDLVSAVVNGSLRPGPRSDAKASLFSRMLWTWKSGTGMDPLTAIEQLSRTLAELPPSEPMGM